jgi:hypothetical protein
MPTDNDKALVAATPEQVKKDLELTDPTDVKTGDDKELEAKAEGFVKALFEIDVKQRERAEQGKAAVETMGAQLQKQASQQSEMLKKPMSALSKRGEEGGQVAKSLVDLSLQVQELNPN